MSKSLLPPLLASLPPDDVRIPAYNYVHRRAWRLAKQARRFGIWIDVRDLFQAGVLGVERARRTFVDDGRATFFTYAVYLIRNEQASVWRATYLVGGWSKKRPVQEGPIVAARLLDEIVDGLPQPDEALEVAEGQKRLEAQIAAVRDALNTLRPTPQRAIRSHFLGGQTLEEIGQELGVSRQAVHQAQKRGLNTLRTALKHWVKNDDVNLGWLPPSPSSPSAP